MKKSLAELHKELETIGLPVAHRQWEEGAVPPLPYIIYYESGKKAFHADNKPYFVIKTISVELYTENKDEETEALLEAFFYAHDISLTNIEEEFWDDEHLHEVLYEFDLV